MNFKTTARALATLVLTASAVAAPAMAQSVDGPISVTVRYADLDIGHAAGAAMLLRRLQAAADQACGGASHELDRMVAYEHCRDETLSRAVARVNAPLLTAAAKPVAAIRVALR